MIFPCMEPFLVIFQAFHEFQSLWEPCIILFTSMEYYLLANWVILHALLSSADFFFQNQFFPKMLSGIQQTVQAPRFVWPDLGQNCL